MVQHSDPIAEAIGTRVRGQRLDRNWTLDQLSDSSGVSRRMLINIEQGAANPSLSTLLKLSEALGVGLPALVEPPSPKVKLTPAGAGTVLWKGEHGGRGVLVAHTESPGVVELWEWTLRPGESHSSEAHTPGTRELLHVHAGPLVVEVDGEPHRAKAGDALSFPGDVPHSYAHAEGESARFSLTVYEPGGSSGFHQEESHG
ncbi:helix-turn-helix domain-containing protein [Nesterenkonia lacusekhoensis]|uniref:helix-turn-helix domain-containing protein n=1 Tax=Nesterenkonia lacusekhoensis TaxID=150832 RepID=UPI001AE96D3B|nr:XRE family transcriptional regulator [Nesterenkonia lacusekhoensis]